MKRVLAFILTLVLLMSAYPAAMVSAAEIEKIPEETSAETLLEMAEEPAVPELSASEFTVIADPGLPDNEELFAAYAQQKLYGSSFSFLGTAAGERLTGDEKLIYDAVLPYLRQIASGERKSTIISLGKTVSYEETTYTPDIKATFTGGALTQESLGRILDALLSDLPYEMYWYAKTIGCKTFLLSTSEPSTMVFAQLKFPVAGNYAGSGDYTADTAKTGAASKVAAKANAIVAKYADKPAYEKLVGYKEEICNLVSYNHNAANTGVYAVDNDPWQLIYVFDGDESTKVVCEGYSKAFMYLCDLSDFRGNTTCYTVTGTMNGGGHMWNIVTLGGKNYLVDVTNSDSGMVGQNGGLFLAGASGSPVQGYTVNNIKYIYDADMLTLWGSDSGSILNLSAKPYGDCQHDYVSVVTPPTCTERGYTTHTCACGDTYQDTYVDKLDHQEVVDAGVAATCTTPGLSEGKHCQVCGEVIVSQEVIDAWGHDEKVDEAVAPTCGVSGLTEGSHCERCGQVMVEQQPVDALQHEAVADEAVAPTCTEKGMTAGEHCKNCGKVLVAQEPVNALGHKEVIDAGIKPTCTTDGVSDGKHCETCGEILVAQEIISAGHTVKVDEAVAPTCGVPGLTEGSHCEVCGKVLVAQEPLDALEHKIIADAAVEPSCTETGLTAGSHCSLCGEIIVAQQPIDALGHKEVQIPGRAPTCTKKGQKEGKYCETCAEVLVVPETVAALGHAWDEGVVTKEPTMEETGIRTYTCTVCGETKTEEIPCKDHEHDYTAEVVPATCTEQGYTTHTCACGDTYKDTYVNALGHTWDNGVVTKESTMEETGIRTYTCTVCGETKTEEIPCRDHEHDYAVNVVPATYTKQGYTEHTCVCGETYRDSYTKAKGLPKPNVKVSNNSKGKPVLSWADCDEADYYYVYRATSKSGKKTYIGKTTGGSYTDSKASLGKTYYYFVKAVCAEDSSLSSSYSTYDKACGKTAAPSVTVSVSSSTGKPIIKWKKVTGAKKYTIYRATSKSGTYKALKSTTSTSYTDTSAKPGTTYYYKVKVNASKGRAYDSIYSSVKSGKCIPAKPAAKIALSKNKPKVSWKKVSGATKYEVYRSTKKSSGFTKIKTTSSVSFRDSTAKKGKIYYYKVVAVKGSAKSAYSNTVKIKSK